MNADDRAARLARARLEQSLEELDPITVERLAASRRRALAQAARPRPQRRRWAPAAGLAVAASLAVLALLVARDPQIPAAAPVDALELLAAEEPLELYQELEFYLWLEQQSRSGADTG